MDVFYQAFEWESSELDWCEPNFMTTQYIAEFFNTISNVLFFVCPPLLMSLFSAYARHISYGCNVVWALLFLVGLGSAYFHATLSLAGQLVDEFGILWVFNAAMALWIPKRYLPTWLKDNNLVRCHRIIILLSLIGTVLGCVYPWVNSIVLMTFGIPTAIIMYREIKRSQDLRLQLLGQRTMAVWACAVSIWTLDRVFCPFWLAIGVPYLHSIWHLLIATTSYCSIVFFAVIDTRERYSDHHPELAFWPTHPVIERTGLGIPFVKIAPHYDSTVEKRPHGLCGPMIV